MPREVDCTSIADEDTEVVDEYADLDIADYAKLPFAKQAKQAVLKRVETGRNTENDPLLCLLEKMGQTEFQAIMEKEFKCDGIEYRPEYIEDVMAKLKDSDYDATDILDAAAPPEPALVQAAARAKEVANALEVAQTGAKSGGNEAIHAMTQAASRLLGIARGIVDSEEDEKKPAAVEKVAVDSKKRKVDSGESVTTERTKKTNFTSKSFTGAIMPRSTWE